MKIHERLRVFLAATALLTNGLYRWSRNPIYLSMALLLGGLALFQGALSPWMVPPLFMVILNRHFIVPEEAMLAEAFGAEYRDYVSRVRRWF